MKQNYKLKIIDYIYNVTFFVLFYSVLTISYFSFNLPKIKELDKYTPHSILHSYNQINSNLDWKMQKALLKKLHIDLSYRNLLNKPKKNTITQISIDKEGHIIGYKPLRLIVMNYSLEKQTINLLKKNITLKDPNKSIYWLKLTNKY
nr:hypothetical protein [Rhodomonas sp. NIES-698]